MTQLMYEFMLKMMTQGSVKASAMKRVTIEALDRAGFIQECVRLYFGPRDLQYKLSEKGRKYVWKRRVITFPNGGLGVLMWQRAGVGYVRADNKDHAWKLLAEPIEASTW